MKNLKKLIAIAVASSMVMSTTVLAKTTTTNSTANYQKANTTYGENFDSAIAATNLPTSVTSIITTLYGKYGMNQTQENTILKVVNNLIAQADAIKATATANGTTTPTYYDIATKDSAFKSYAIGQAQIITGSYGTYLVPNATMTGGSIHDNNTGAEILSVDASQFNKNDFQNVSRDKATLLAQLTTALNDAVAATANGANTEMPVATPTTTATSTATTGVATGTTAPTATATGTAATGTTVAATGTTTGGNTNPGAGAGTGGDVATGITYGQALDNAIAATKLPISVTSIITTLYGKYGMNQIQENTILSVVNNLIAQADAIKASATANGTTTPGYYQIATTDSAFRSYAIGQVQRVTGSYGTYLVPNATMTGGSIHDNSTGAEILSVDASQFNKDDFKNVSHDKATLLAQLKTALDAAVAATTYGSTTVIPTSTATATNPGTTTATTTPGTTTATTTPGTTTATTTPGTATGTTTAPTPVQDLANNLTNLGVPANLVTTITNTLNALPSNVADKVASIVNTFLKSARSATDLATAKAAIDADSTLTDAQKTAAKAALDQVAILAPATTTPATGTATGTTTPDTSAILQLVNTIGNNAQDALNALATLFTKDPVAANALSAKINAYLSSQTQANYDAALAAINSADLSQAEKDALIKIIGARPAVDAATGTATSTTAGGSTNGSATTPSLLPKTATEAANMAVAGLAMITIAGTVFFISKKRMA